MRVFSTIGALAAAATMLSGCLSAEDENLEGITLAGGNAIAINSALQIIDPWPANVQNTDLIVPADRADAAAADASGGGDGATTALSE
jgi:hypothetical protein